MLYLASDHAGFKMKEKVKKYLTKKSIIFEDLGTYEETSCDYPVVARTLCNKIKDEDNGILICGTGIGMSIQANRYTHIRAGLCVTPKMAEMTRQHNNANVLCLQGRNKSLWQNKKIIHKFLTTKFEGGRHQRRVNYLSENVN